MSWAQLISIFVAWSLNKGIPAVWHHHTDNPKPTKTQVEQAKILYEGGDPEAMKIQALQGMKPVIRLEAKPVQQNDTSAEGAKDETK